mgnify:FL=1
MLRAMRLTGRCPKCQCPKVWQIDPVVIPDFRWANTSEVLPVITRSAKGGLGVDRGSRQAKGWFEMWICSGCGCTEWYAAEVNETLATLARTPEISGVRFHDNEPTT